MVHMYFDTVSYQNIYSIKFMNIVSDTSEIRQTVFIGPQ